MSLPLLKSACIHTLFLVVSASAVYALFHYIAIIAVIISSTVFVTAPLVDFATTAIIATIVSIAGAIWLPHLRDPKANSLFNWHFRQFSSLPMEEYAHPALRK